MDCFGNVFVASAHHDQYAQFASHQECESIHDGNTKIE